MQNKINLDTHNEVIPVNEPWHRGSGFTWMLLALAGAVFLLSGAVAKAAGDIFDGYIQIGGTWYNVGGVNDGRNNPSGSANASSRTLLNNQSFGTQNYGGFNLTGYQINGWTSSGTSVVNSGANYRVWRNADTKPGYSNFWDTSDKNYYQGGDYVSSVTSQSTGIIGATLLNGETYNLEIQTFTVLSGVNAGAKFYERTGTFTVNGARQEVDISISANQSGVYNTSVAGGVVKKGSATLTLTEDNSNAETGQKGDIYVTAGTVAILPGAGVSGDNALGGSFTKVRLGETSGSSTATFTLADTDGGLSVSREINVRGGSSGTKTISSSNSSGENTLSGKILLDASVDISATSGGTLALSGNFDNDTAGDKNVFFIGNGTVSLSGSTSNIDIASYTVNNGSTLKLNKSGGADAIQSTLNVSGTAELTAANQLGASATVNNNGTFATAGNNDAFGTLNSSGNITGNGTLTATTYNITGGTVDANLGTGTLNASGNSVISGNTQASTMNVTGDTTLNGASSATAVAVTGSGTDLTLGSGSNRLSSSADVRLGGGTTLSIASDQTVAMIREHTQGSTGGTASIANGATLTVNGANQGTKYMNSISGQGGLTMAGSGDTVLGLYGAQSYTGATTVTSGKITSAVGMASTAYNVSGGTMETTEDSVIANNSAISISGTGNFSVGGNDTIGTVTATGGRLTVANGKTAVLNGNSSIGASADMVGGTIQVGTATPNSGTLALNSDDADNNSAITIASGGTLSGSGTTKGTLEVGGRLAPGNSTGILDVGDTTFLGGGTYQWEIDNFTGTVGTNWDFLNITGDLTISANSGSQFIIDVISLLASNDTAGLASNFNDATNYTFAIATASGTISGYASNAFSINTAGFQNSFTGQWGTSLSIDGKSLNITYTATAIPEPSSAALTLIGLGVLALRRRCRR